MSDIAFYGERRKVTFEQGREIRGKSMESTVMTGGHLRDYGSNSRQCKAYITPLLTSNLIQKSRLYAEDYNRESKSPNYRGVIQYIGSNTQKMSTNTLVN